MLARVARWRRTGRGRWAYYHIKLDEVSERGGTDDNENEKEMRL